MEEINFFDDDDELYDENTENADIEQDDNIEVSEDAEATEDVEVSEDVENTDDNAEAASDTVTVE
jgi:hypothetical protein